MHTVERPRTVPRQLVLFASGAGATAAFCAVYLLKHSFVTAAAAALAVALAPLIAVTPLAAVSLLVCVNLTGLVESVSFAATGSLVLGIAAVAYSAYTGRLTLRWSPVYTAALVLVAVDAISIVEARAPELTKTAVTSELRDLLTFVVIAVLLSSVRNFRVVAWVGVLTAGALAGITILHEFVLHDQGTLMGLSHLVGGGVGTTTSRQTGPLLDPNFWARVLILAAPLALSLAAFERRTRLRVLALAVAAVIGAGVVLTESRGGMVGLGVAVVAWLVLAGRRYLFLLLAVPLLVNLLLVTPVAGPRLDTLLNPTRGADAPTDYSIAQREQIARVSARLIEAHPVLGVGYGNFSAAAEADEARHGEDSGLTAAHNLYLQLAAEGGVVGVLAWCGFVGATAFAFGRSWSLNRRRQRDRHRVRHRSCEEWLAIGGLASLIGWLAASLFLHLSQFRALLVVVALAVALDVVARASTEPTDDHDVDRYLDHDGADVDVPTPRRMPVTARQLVATAVAVALVAATVVTIWPPRTSHWEATATMYISPTDSANTRLQSYRYTVLSGAFVQRTFSNLLESDAFVRRAGLAHGLTPAQIDDASVTVSGSAESGRLTVAVSAPDRRSATALAAAVADTGATMTSSLQTVYSVSPGSDRGAVFVTDWDLKHVNAGVLLVDLVLVVAIVVIRRRDRVRGRALVP